MVPEQFIALFMFHSMHSLHMVSHGEIRGVVVAAERTVIRSFTVAALSHLGRNQTFAVGTGNGGWLLLLRIGLRLTNFVEMTKKMAMKVKMLVHFETTDIALKAEGEKKTQKTYTSIMHNTFFRRNKRLQYLIHLH